MNYQYLWQILVLVSLPYLLLGQDGAEYPNYSFSDWSKNSYLRDISADGNWVLIQEVYDSADDNYLLINSNNDLRLDLGSGSFFNFRTNWFGYIDSDSVLNLINLKNLKVKQYKGVEYYSFANSKEALLYISNNDSLQYTHTILNLENSSRLSLKQGSEIIWNPKNHYSAIYEDGKVSILNLNDFSQYLIYEGKNKIKNIVWGNTGKTLALIEMSNSDSSLIMIEFSFNSKAFEFKTYRLDNYQIADNNLNFSNGDKWVHFYIENQENNIEQNEEMEIWNTDSKYIYPKNQFYKQTGGRYITKAWNREQNVVVNVTDSLNPTAIILPETESSIIFNRKKNEPNFKQRELIDFYSKNLVTQEEKLIEKNLYSYSGHLKVSPSGRYFVFFHEKNWWVYDNESNVLKNITKNLEIEFENKNDSPKEYKQPYGHPGWTKGEKQIILYDEFDVWLIDSDGENPIRLTKGREAMLQYRIDINAHSKINFHKQALKSDTSYEFDCSNYVILKFSNSSYNYGVALWSKQNEVEVLFHSTDYISEILMDINRKNLFYKTVKYNKPPAYWHYNLTTNEKKLLYQTNQDYRDIDLGKYRIIEGKSKGKKIKSSLIYPSNFDPEKKYPMIVLIYEKASNIINYYSSPSLYDPVGFNLLFYVRNGYFILFPDIEYEIGQPGKSALDYVEMSTLEAIKRESSIDSDNVGLIGHSFGGYQTAFIVTKSDLFKTAVAGAPVSDLSSWYHDVLWDWKMDQMWRIENQQFRMGGPFYLHKENYRKNSPLYFVENMKTPLLIWAGKLDSNINWSQSIYLHMAMRRLNKPGKLVLFNREGHNITKKENQQILSRQIFEWFESYLKK